MSDYAPMRSFRCPDEIYLKFKFISKQENRSVNKQIIHVMSKFIQDYEREHGVIEVDTDALYE